MFRLGNKDVKNDLSPFVSKLEDSFFLGIGFHTNVEC